MYTYLFYGGNVFLSLSKCVDSIYLNSYQRYQAYTLDARIVYIRVISDTQMKIIRKPNKYEVEEQNVVPNTAKVIKAWDKKILIFSKNIGAIGASY